MLSNYLASEVKWYFTSLVFSTTFQIYKAIPILSQTHFFGHESLDVSGKILWKRKMAQEYTEKLYRLVYQEYYSKAILLQSLAIL